MRLGTCVALEAVVGVAVLGGAAVGAWYAYGAARDYAESFQPEARAAVLPARPLVTPIEPAVLDHGPATEPALPAAAGVAGLQPWGTVFPRPDDELLAPLREASLTAAAINRQGGSLTMRLDFAGGGRAAFKPEQSWEQSARPRHDVAAYRIDRLLGIGHVAPAIGRSFGVPELVAAFEEDSRGFAARQIRNEGRARRTGELAGSVSWWIPEVVRVKIHGYEVDSTDGIVTWRRYLRVGADIPDDDRYLVEQLSAMTLFDFVIDNIDRWSGGNMRAAPGGSDVYFMDNTDSFTPKPGGHIGADRYLERVQVFSRRIVDRLRAMTEADLRAALEPDRGPFPSLLTEPELLAVMSRRALALAYIDRLIARHGEDVVLAFP